MATIGSVDTQYKNIEKQEKEKSGTTTSSGSLKTDRGTPIMSSYNDSMNQVSFMKMLAAQLQNLDPSSDQDPTAYITQMAQFVEMQHMEKLNTTMSDFSNRELIGKMVVLRLTDNKGQNIVGEVETIYKNNGQSYLTLKGDPDNKLYSVDDVRMVTSNVEDNSQAITAINTAFVSASKLASNKSNVLIQVTDEDGNKSTVKGQAVGAYINNSDVMLKINVMNDNGELTDKIEDYSYFSILKAGDLKHDELKKDAGTTVKDAEEKDQNLNSSFRDTSIKNRELEFLNNYVNL